MTSSTQGSIQLSRVAFSFGGAPLFSDVSLRLEPGWHGVVGANGSGKSTLLRLLAGDLVATTGAIAGGDGVVRLCPQEVDDAHLGDFSLAWDKPAMRLRSALALDEEELARWPSLSPGERKRWQIAAALHAAPEVLLLDEPENHLDAEARALLLDALERFAGIGVVVSHDRDFLDGLTTRTLWLEGGRVRVLASPYSAAREVVEQERSALATVARDRARQVKRAVRQLRQKREVLAAAERQRHSSARMKSPRDHDARSGLAKGLSEQASATLARQLAAQKTKVARAEAERRAVRVEKQHGSAMQVEHEAGAPDPLLRFVGDVAAGDRVVLTSVSCVLGRHGRVHLAGPNGAGKSSLLAALEATIGWPRERLLSLPQELDRERRRAIAAAVRDAPAADRGAWLARASALGVDPEAVLASPLPSPGEARKLVLARALSEGAWCLLLDEPENHLDVPSIERLEAALSEYTGALVLVTHDARLARRVTSETWRLASGTLTLA